MSESPWSAMKRMDAAERAGDIIGYLSARADWLRAERMHGGSLELAQLEEACRYLAARFDRGGFVVDYGV